MFDTGDIEENGDDEEKRFEDNFVEEDRRAYSDRRPIHRPDDKHDPPHIECLLCVRRFVVKFCLLLMRRIVLFHQLQ